ncbi:MAG: TlpA disulfide reductase family protein [bacterium]|nr:TlpA disulfide reductase family protein [bacterium]
MQKWKAWLLLIIGTIILTGCQTESPPLDKGLKLETPQEEEIITSSDTETLEVIPPEEIIEVASLPEKKSLEKVIPPKPKWGNAPDFTLDKLEGGVLTLSDLVGKVVILDFWATWCPPCRMEIPGFVELYSKYKGKGVEIIGLSLDRQGESVVRSFAQQHQINYPLVMATPEIVMAYGGVQSIPTTFLIDRQGNIANRHIGFAAKDVFESEINALLAKGSEG